MDFLLGKVTQHAMNYAIRSGITITASYALRQSARLLKNAEGNEREELQDLQERLDSKIRIISPAIDMIELIAARGNTSLESAVSLTKSLRWDIQNLGQRLAVAANEEDSLRRGISTAKPKAQNELELKRIILQIRKLLGRIEDAVPLVNLAIATSGASLSTTLPTTISPSRLLQASTFLTAGDTQYSVSSSKSVQIGPTFILSLYMLFSGNVRPENEEDIRQSTWKEVIHKARLKLVRVPLDSIYSLPDPASNLNFSSNFSGGSSEPNDGLPVNIQAESKADEFAYQIIIVEDLEDGRVHTFEEDEPQPATYDDVDLAGIREAIPIHEISKIFYADTGKILNIGSDGETNSPVLLLKRDTNAIPPRRMMERFGGDRSPVSEGSHHLPQLSPPEDGADMNQSQIDAQIQREHRSSSVMPEPEGPALEPASDFWRIPTNLDPEWLAFEVYTEEPESDTESEVDISTSTPPGRPYRSSSIDPRMTRALSKLDLDASRTSISKDSRPSQSPSIHQVSGVPQIRTSLSLLETILRLLSLQQFQQNSHLSIPDELLNFFLSESATTGAAHGDEQERRRLRNEARRRVGFDPYDESPIKRRGEDYQHRGGESQRGWNEAIDDDQYHDFSEYQGDYAGYSSPRHDEGYETHQFSGPAPYARYGSRERTPETPPLQLRNQPHSSRGNTPDRSTPSLPTQSSTGARTYPSPSTPSGRMGVKSRTGRMRFEDAGVRGLNKGSPLARPTTGITDEGLGTSPQSVVSAKKEEK